MSKNIWQKKIITKYKQKLNVYLLRWYGKQQNFSGGLFCNLFDCCENDSWISYRIDPQAFTLVYDNIETAFLKHFALNYTSLLYIYCIYRFLDLLESLAKRILELVKYLNLFVVCLKLVLNFLFLLLWFRYILQYWT